MLNDLDLWLFGLIALVGAGIVLMIGTLIGADYMLKADRDAVPDQFRSSVRGPYCLLKTLDEVAEERMAEIEYARVGHQSKRDVP